MASDSKGERISPPYPITPVIALPELGTIPEDFATFDYAAEGDFRLTPDAALYGLVGFRPIPIEEIGLYEDVYRAT